MKKYLTLLLLLALTITHSIGAWAADDIDRSFDRPFYKSFTGTITTVEERDYLENGKFISLEAQDGSPANFVVSQNTFVESSVSLQPGETITGFYDATRPMIMIYPPQYTIEVITRGEIQEGENVFVGYFDNNLISFENFLQISLGDETVVIDAKEQPFTNSLAYKKLLVYYGPATRSIPAQTVPVKVIVLDHYFKGIDNANQLSADMLINNELFPQQPIYLSDDHMVYVPLRFVAETLGFPVVWQGASQPILLGENISLKPNSGYYTNAEGKQIQLRDVPDIKEGTTFVPLSFFREVLNISNAFYSEEKIKMHSQNTIQ